MSAWALGEIRDPQAIAPLTQMMENEKDDTVIAVLKHALTTLKPLNRNHDL